MSAAAPRSAVCVVAAGGVSALGLGVHAWSAGEVGRPATSAIAHDERMHQAGFARPQLARATADLGQAAGSDRAVDLLRAALRQLGAELDRVEPAWRELRVGVCLGTSSGGMLEAEKFFEARARGGSVGPEQARHATYFAPMDRALPELGLLAQPVKRSQVLAACASSTIAIGLGMRWLDRGACDLVVAGGYDAISTFVAAGFEAIRATVAGPPQPFRVGRDGMVLGEGVGVVALKAEPPPGCSPLAYIAGFGASCDAVHITAPDREGGGLVRAGLEALAEAGQDGEALDLVSVHGTSTPFNDAMESKAVARLCAPAAPVVHPFKAQIGHTLGAAGALELLSAIDALDRGVAPAAAGDAPLDPEAPATLLPSAEARDLNSALKMSAAFGGVTACLCVTRRARERQRPAPRTARLLASAAVRDVDRVQLSAKTGVPRDRLARIDDLGQLTVAAVAALVDVSGREALDGAGVVAGQALATLDTNERFHRRLLDKGPRWVDRRLFPATSPNAGAGHAAIVYGLRGPCFAVGSGLGGALEALVAAAELIIAGDAERMVVVAADDAGPAARAWVELCCPERSLARGAVALLLGPGADPSGPEVDPDRPVEHDRGPIGHLALVEWLKHRVTRPQ
jgi:3-oxoacyl-[acyl-carrier-protein] synthase-1/3-oxoacyl-[acyl-carrier-protein] synthase II